MIHKRAKSTEINFVNICACDDSTEIILCLSFFFLFSHVAFLLLFGGI